MSQAPLAFLSYANLDDQHEQGRLTQLRERLSGEVRMHTGQAFEIFQDRKDIVWGQPWEKRINDSLAATTFLLPIITPSFFNSAYCRDELKRFLKREKELGRDDLILPIYYVNCLVLEDKEELKHNSLAQVIAARQYEDWRELRYEELSSQQVRKSLAKMAQQIAAALHRSRKESARAAAVQPVSKPPEKENVAGGSSANTFQAESGGQSIAQGNNAIGTQINNYYNTPPTKSKPQPGPVVKIEPPTVIVDQKGRGDYATITDALKAITAGTRILVRPGLYDEGIVLDKPVEIIGNGKRDDIVIEASGKHTVLFQADSGRIANLTLRQAGSGTWHGVNITKGRFEIENCDISNQNGPCVAIRGSANPTLCCNRIHDGKLAGVLVSEYGQGTLEDNEIFANAYAGVHISTGGNPILRRNRIHDGKAGGVFVFENGQGILEDNEIFANAYTGVKITTGGKPTLRRNIISNNGGTGIWVYDKGGGIFENNDLRGNDRSAYFIDPDSAARVQWRGNKE